MNVSSKGLEKTITIIVDTSLKALPARMLKFLLQELSARVESIGNELNAPARLTARVTYYDGTALVEHDFTLPAEASEFQHIKLPRCAQGPFTEAITGKVWDTSKLIVIGSKVNLDKPEMVSSLTGNHQELLIFYFKKPNDYPEKVQFAKALSTEPKSDDEKNISEIRDKLAAFLTKDDVEVLLKESTRKKCFEKEEQSPPLEEEPLQNALENDHPPQPSPGLVSTRPSNNLPQNNTFQTASSFKPRGRNLPLNLSSEHSSQGSQSFITPRRKTINPSPQNTIDQTPPTFKPRGRNLPLNLSSEHSSKSQLTITRRGTINPLPQNTIDQTPPTFKPRGRNLPLNLSSEDSSKSQLTITRRGTINPLPQTTIDQTPPTFKPRIKKIALNLSSEDSSKSQLLTITRRGTQSTLSQDSIERTTSTFKPRGRKLPLNLSSEDSSKSQLTITRRGTINTLPQITIDQTPPTFKPRIKKIALNLSSENSSHVASPSPTGTPEIKNHDDSKQSALGFTLGTPSLNKYFSENEF